MEQMNKKTCLLNVMRNIILGSIFLFVILSFILGYYSSKLLTDIDLNALNWFVIYFFGSMIVFILILVFGNIWENKIISLFNHFFAKKNDSPIKKESLFNILKELVRLILFILIWFVPFLALLRVIDIFLKITGSYQDRRFFKLDFDPKIGHEIGIGNQIKKIKIRIENL